MASQVKTLVKSLRKQGFEVTQARNGHLNVVAPDGAKTQIAGTPRCNGNGFKNMVVRLRRIGYDDRAS